MYDFNCYANTYILHDTIINKISVNKSGLCLCFDEGVYVVSNACDTVPLKTSASEMKIHIKNMDSDRFFQHVEIKKIHKSKIKEINFNALAKLLTKTGLKIYMDYFSTFGNSILLKGIAGKSEIELCITEVEEVVFKFSET